MVFPNWGAIAANTLNSTKRKSVGLIGSYVKERATTKDKLIAFAIMFGIAVFILSAFILYMWLTN